MIDSYMSIHLQDSVEILDRLREGKKWSFLKNTLKKYTICYDFLLEDRDELYLQYWREVENELGVTMESELALVNDSWLARHSLDFNIRTNARLGAFLRFAGCSGDFTLRLTLEELGVLREWKEKYWSVQLYLGLAKIYAKRGLQNEAQKIDSSLCENCRNTESIDDQEFLSFGHELLDAELLEVTEPVFMDCVDGLPRNSLRYRYNLAKYFRRSRSGSSYETEH